MTLANASNCGHAAGMFAICPICRADNVRKSRRDPVPVEPKTEQYYVFTMPGDSCPIWVEGFDDMGHWVAPSPFFDLESALSALDELHPGAHVDSLCYAEDITSARLLAKVSAR